LVDAALQWKELKEAKEALLRTPRLELALEWKRKLSPAVGTRTPAIRKGGFEPEEAWAARYGNVGDLDIALKFLDASEKEQRREQALDRVKRARRVRWRVVSVALGVTAVVCLATCVGYFYLYRVDYVEYYNTYTKQYDQPVGIGELSADQVSHRQLSFRIVKQGRWGRVLRLQAVNSSGKLTSRHAIGTRLEDNATGLFDEPGREVSWEYAYRQEKTEVTTEPIWTRVRRAIEEVFGPNKHEDEVISETALDAKDNIVWRFVYIPRDPSDP
jgi:hypothetical protein